MGVGDVAMLVNQRIAGVAPHKFDRDIKLIFTAHAVACGGHFRAMIDGVCPGKNGDLRFYRVIQHRKPLYAEVPGAFTHAGVAAVDPDVAGQDREHGDRARSLFAIGVTLRPPALTDIRRFC